MMNSAIANILLAYECDKDVCAHQILLPQCAHSLEVERCKWSLAKSEESVLAGESETAAAWEDSDEKVAHDLLITFKMKVLSPQEFIHLLVRNEYILSMYTHDQRTFVYLSYFLGKEVNPWGDHCVWTWLEMAYYSLDLVERTEQDLLKHSRTLTPYRPNTTDFLDDMDDLEGIIF